MSTTTALRDEAVSPQRPKHAGLRTRAAACVALLMHMPAEGTAQSEQGIDQFDPEPMLGPRWVQLLDLGDEARSGRWLIAEAVVPVSVLALPAVGDESEEPPPQACELRVGAFVHQYNAADMHGGGGTCTVAARVTRNSTLVVRVELSPGDHESVRGGASYAWFEFEVAPSGVIPVVHADDEWWQTAPGPASLIAAARASCDWDLLEELGAPTDERGACSDRRGRELLGHANRAASDVLAHLSDPGDFYDLDPDDQYREILAIAGLSAGLQNEVQRARQRYRDAIDRHGASRETALERAYRRGDAPAFEVAERSGREPGWRTPEQQPDRGQAERDRKSVV